MKLSDFGQRFNRYSGITHLMDDLNQGLLRDDVVMLGGGNPAGIPQAEEIFQRILQRLSANGELLRAMANYDGPQGRQPFLEVLADYFNQHYGWGISDRNITLTHGSQSAFFSLFNSFAGQSATRTGRILLPLTPEYIGYADVGIEDGLFNSFDPRIENLDKGFFKYHIDFEALDVDEDTALICVSRPTNPSGNVLTDHECARLDAIARRHDVPLLVDNAYGTPFPHIIYDDVNPFWNDNTILCLSLSKLGLPGVRTGIVIANEDIIRLMSNLTAITSLAPGGVGPVVVGELLANGALDDLCDEVIRPFYLRRGRQAVDWLREAVNDPRLHIHVPEGAFFLWLWFEGLPVTTSELYQRLKQKGLLVVPGRYFFPGRENSEHAESCVRLNYARSEADVRKGIDILASTLKEIW